MANKDAALKIFSCCFGIIILVGIILFAISFKIVEINQAALKKNTFSVQVEPNTVYLSGRYFTGVAGQFITYDTTWYSVEFSKEVGSDSGVIRAKTSQASEVELDITFMYRLKVEFLHELFAKYPAKNQGVDLVNTAKEKIQGVIIKYSIDDLFSKRAEIASDMSFEVSKALRTSFFAEVTVFLIREMTLQSRFETNILNSLISLRQAETATERTKIGQLEAQISVIDSQADIKINQIAATAAVTSSKARATKEAEGEKLVLTALSTSLKAFKDGLGFTTNDQLNRFLFLDKTRNFNRSTIYSGFGSDTVFKL